MDNKDVMRMLQEEGKGFVPDVRSRLIAALGLRLQGGRQPFIWQRALKPVFALFSIVLVFAVFYVVHRFFWPLETSPTIVTVSVNPSFEFVVDKDRVIDYRALTVDAVPIVAELDIEADPAFDRVLMDLIRILEEAGYLDPLASTAQVRLQAINDHPKQEERFIARMEKMVDRAKVLVIKPTKAIEKEAKREGVSPNKWMLVQQALKADPTLTKEQAKRLSVKALNDIIRGDGKDEVDHFYHEYRHYIEQLQQTKEQERSSYAKRFEQAIKRLQAIERSYPPLNRDAIIRQLEHLDEYFTDIYSDEEWQLLMMVARYRTLVRIADANEWEERDQINDMLDKLFKRIVEKLEGDGIRDAVRQRPDVRDILEIHRPFRKEDKGH